MTLLFVLPEFLGCVWALDWNTGQPVRWLLHSLTHIVKPELPVLGISSLEC